MQYFLHSEETTTNAHLFYTGFIFREEIANVSTSAQPSICVLRKASITARGRLSATRNDAETSEEKTFLVEADHLFRLMRIGRHHC